MSSAAQLGREEAERVEAEEAEAAEEEEATPEPEPEPEPEPVEPVLSAPVDPEKIERAAKTYLNAIAKAFGDAADQLQPCTRCSGELLGFEPIQPPLELKQAPDKEMCPMCEGLASFLTGAKVGEWVTASCTRCNGKGFVEKALQEPINLAAFQYTPPPAAPPYPGHGIAFVPIEGGVPDSFGRPAGHPHYGLPREHSQASGIS